MPDELSDLVKEMLARREASRKNSPLAPPEVPENKIADLLDEAPGAGPVAAWLERRNAARQNSPLI